MNWQRVPRSRWQSPVRIALLGLYCAMPWLFRTVSGGGLDKIVAGVAFGVALALEMLVKPRLELPASRVCPRCSASSPPSGRACLFCGREWISDEHVLYAPYLADIPAARVAHRRAITLMIALGVATLIPMFVFATQVAMAWYFVVMYYAYDLTTGTLLKRTHAALIEHAGGLCTHCTYPLVESASQCPECGVIGSVREARRAWAESGLWHPDEAMARDMVAAKASGA